MNRDKLTWRERLVKLHFALVSTQPSSSMSKKQHAKWAKKHHDEMVLDLWLHHLEHEGARTTEGKTWLNHVRDNEFPKVSSAIKLAEWLTDATPDMYDGGMSVWEEFTGRFST